MSSSDLLLRTLLRPGLDQDQLVSCQSNPWRVRWEYKPVFCALEIVKISHIRLCSCAFPTSCLSLNGFAEQPFDFFRISSPHFYAIFNEFLFETFVIYIICVCVTRDWTRISQQHAPDGHLLISTVSTHSRTHTYLHIHINNAVVKHSRQMFHGRVTNGPFRFCHTFFPAFPVIHFSAKVIQYNFYMFVKAILKSFGGGEIYSFQIWYDILYCCPILESVHDYLFCTIIHVFI